MGVMIETVQDVTPTTTPAKIAVAAPSRGTIRRIRLIQTAGTPAGFTYSLFSASDALAADGNLVAGVSELYRIMPMVTVGAADGALLGSFEGSFSYCNQDGNLSNRERKIYMQLTVVGGLPGKTFKLALVIEDPSSP